MDDDYRGYPHDELETTICYSSSGDKCIILFGCFVGLGRMLGLGGTCYIIYILYIYIYIYIYICINNLIFNSVIKKNSIRVYHILFVNPDTPWNIDLQDYPISMAQFCMEHLGCLSPIIICTCGDLMVISYGICS